MVKIAFYPDNFQIRQSAFNDYVIMYNISSETLSMLFCLDHSLLWNEMSIWYIAENMQ